MASHLRIGTLALISLVWMAYGARITITPKEITGKKTGDTISINCRADEVGSDVEEDVRAKWSKVVNGEDIPIPTGGSRVFARPGANRTSVVLIVERADLTDVGEYKCSFGEDSAILPIKDLYRSVTFINTNTEQNPLVGSEAEIKCRADGDPAPEISWLKDDNSIVENGDYSFKEDGDLVIKNYDKEKHDGVYMCEAIQLQTGDMKKLPINVTGHMAPGPMIVAIADQEKWTKGVHEGATKVRLTCSSGGVPTPVLKWSMGGGEIVADDRYALPEPGVLEIQVMSPETAGTFTCIATNSVGKSEAGLNVDIYLKPQITKYDETASINFGESFSSPCVYTGGDNLNAAIKKNGVPITERAAVDDGEGVAEGSGDVEQQNEQYVTIKDKTATLNIKSATLDDAGDYECTVSNEAGEVSKTLKLEVRKAPSIASYTDETVRALMATRFSVYCEAFAVPEAKWTWFRKVGDADIVVQNQDGHFEIAGDGRNSTLAITPLSDDDFTQYTCKADNGVKPAASKEIKLMKIESPQTPVLTCDDDASKPTIISIKSETFSSTEPENRRPFKIHVVTSDASGDKQFSLDFAQDGVYRLTKLEPSADYLLNVTGENEAGISEMGMITCRTKEPTAPGKPVFTMESPLRCSVAECPLEWIVEDDGGKPITEYVVEYRPVVTEGDPDLSYTEARTSDTRFVFSNLQSATTYDVKVKAVNSQGSGEEAGITLIAPDESRQVGGDSSQQSATGPSTGAIVGIVVIIILIIVVLVDVACYYVNQCGLLMCICVNLCGKTPPEVKAKETMMEEGGAAKDTRFEERQEKQPLKEENVHINIEKVDMDASESTPMM